jgi:RNA polymerase sigma factor (sigma-70 family)
MLDCSTIRFPDLLPGLYRQAARKVPPGEVDDLVQETLLGALTAHYRGEAAPATWVQAILRHKIADYYRQQRGYCELPDAIAETLDVLGCEDMAALRIILRDLPQEYARILWLRFYAQLQFSECAETLGIALEAAESRYRRAIGALAREWTA